MAAAPAQGSIDVRWINCTLADDKNMEIRSRCAIEQTLFS